MTIGDAVRVIGEHLYSPPDHRIASTIPSRKEIQALYDEAVRLSAVVDAQREALTEIEARALTRRIGVSMDGISQWSLPLAKEIYIIARDALEGPHGR